MYCPKCRTNKSGVLESRYVDRRGEVKKRRRECKHCGERWTTMEMRVFNNPDYKERRRRKRMYMKQFQDALKQVGDINEPDGS